MGYIARLVYGGDTLDLNDGSTYKLALDFKPPTPSRAVNMASGTFRNKAGGKRQGVQPKDRSWTFSVYCMGTSSAETHSAVNRLQWFLDRCADPSDTLYFEYAPSDAIATNPTWGQMVYRYEIKDSPLNIFDSYGVSNLRNTQIIATATMIIGPHAVGLKQRVGSAIGGVFENNRLATDGHSIGLCIPEATTNLVTNPVAYSAATNWAAMTSATVTRKTSGGPPGIADTCVEVLAADSAGSGVGINYTNRMSATAGTAYTASCYFKFLSGTSQLFAISIVWYNAGAGVISTSTSSDMTMTDDWARYEYTATAPALTSTAYVLISRVTTGVNLYRACAAQFEAKTYATPFCMGTHLGCAWSGTAHASSTARTAARWRIPGNSGEFNNGQGTAVIAWLPDRSSGAADADLAILDTTGSTLKLIWDDSDTRWQLSDGTNTVNGSSNSFTADTPIIFHVVWGLGVLKAYANGSVVCNGSTYTASAAPAYIYLGSENDATNQTNGTYKHLGLWDVQFTSTEITNHYTDLATKIAEGWNDPIPWLWTKDGDDVVDNCDDAEADNYCVCGGIPGSDEALTRWYITPSTLTCMWIGSTRIPHHEFVYPTSQWYIEGSGTGTTAADSGSAVATVSVDTSETELITLTTLKPWLFAGDSHYFVRMSSNTGNLTIAPSYNYTNTTVTGTYKAITTDTTRRLYYVGKLAPQMPDILDKSETRLDLSINGQRTTGTSNALIDFGLAINGPTAYVIPSGLIADAVHFLIQETEATIMDSSYLPCGYCNIRGEAVNLVPDKCNIIWFIDGENGAAHTVANTGTFTKVYITPKWILA